MVALIAKFFVFIFSVHHKKHYFSKCKQGKCGHTRKFCLSSGQIVPRNLVASQGIPVPYEKGSGLIITTSPLPLLYAIWSTMQMLTIKVPNQAKRYNHITPPKTGRKNLGKSTGSGGIFSNIDAISLDLSIWGSCVC